MSEVPPPLFAEGQVVTVFRSRRREGSDADYGRLAEEMETAARALPGFVDFATFAAEDGERVSLITFASAPAHRSWRDDPRHRQAQEHGRRSFYLSYSVQVGECTHTSSWVAGPD